MQLDENFYQHFIEELNCLEEFRMSYSSNHKSDILVRDDPDVKRLIETMAFFSAKTKLSALRNVHLTRQRLFEQFFSFLLTPMPAIGMMQCQPTGQFADTTTLPKETEVIITADQTHEAIFRTTRDLKILPIALNDIELILHHKEGFRILFHFKSPYPNGKEIGELSLYINHLDNYLASLRVQHTLKKHLKEVSIFFDERVRDDSQGIPIDVFFGEPTDSKEVTNATLSHPLQKIRSFFHFPQQELYVNFKCLKTPKDWQNFTISMDMNDSWPKNFTLNKDIFQLFTVPVINLKHTMAQPVLCDGMHEKYVVRYINPIEKFSLHSLIGVYKIEEEEMVPLQSGILGAEEETYEIEHHYEGKTRTQSWLIINSPQSFLSPHYLAIDALWSQPWFSKKIMHDLEASLFSRNIQGTKWKLLGKMIGHQENYLKDDEDSLLQILSLQSKYMLTLKEIQNLIKALGFQKNFGIVFELIDKLEVSVIPHSGRDEGLKHLYKLSLKEVDEKYYPVVKVFLKKLAGVINVWKANIKVEVEAEILNREENLFFA